MTLLALLLLAGAPDAGPPLEPGFATDAQLEAPDAGQLQVLAPKLRSVVETHAPGARVMASCEAPLAPGVHGAAVALVERKGKDRHGKPAYQLRRAVALEDGRWFELDWAHGPELTFSYQPIASRNERDLLFFGTMECLKPAGRAAFEKRFSPGFEKPEARQVDLARATSACFGFDDVYNNWQCWAWSPKAATFVRWGFQATAD